MAIVVSGLATMQQGFGTTLPKGLNGNGEQLIRIVTSTEGTRVSVRTVSVSSIPNAASLGGGAPALNTAIPIWVFRGSSTLLQRSNLGIFTEVDPPTLVGNEGMPFWPLFPASLEVLYLGYVRAQSVAGMTIRFARNTIWARDGGVIAVVAFNPIDLSVNPPQMRNDPVTLTVQGTVESTSGRVSRSIANPHYGSLPRFDVQGH